MQMRHPKIEGTAETDLHAYEKMWKAKGWLLVDGPTESIEESVEPTTLVDSDAEVEDEPDAPRPKKAATRPRASQPEAKEEE